MTTNTNIQLEGNTDSYKGILFMSNSLTFAQQRRKLKPAGSVTTQMITAGQPAQPQAQRLDPGSDPFAEYVQPAPAKLQRATVPVRGKSQPKAVSPAEWGDDDDVTLEQFEEAARKRFGVPKNLVPLLARGYRDQGDPFEQTATAMRRLREQYDALGDIKNDNERWRGAIRKYHGDSKAVGKSGVAADSAPRETRAVYGKTKLGHPLYSRAAADYAKRIEDAGYEITATSNGAHVGQSHRGGFGFDIRTRDLTTESGDALIRDLSKLKGHRKVVDERVVNTPKKTGPHIHWEFDPEIDDDDDPFADANDPFASYSAPQKPATQFAQAEDPFAGEADDDAVLSKPAQSTNDIRILFPEEAAAKRQGDATQDVVDGILNQPKPQQSTFQQNVAKARQPRSGQAVKGVDLTRQDSNIGLDAATLYRAKDLHRAVEDMTAQQFGIAPEDYRKMISLGILDATPYDQAQQKQIRESARYYASVAGDKKVYLPVSQAQRHIIAAFKQGGFDAANVMRGQMDDQSQQFADSLHEVTPEERAESEAAQSAVARDAAIGQNVTGEADLARGILQALGAGDTEVANYLKQFSRNIQDQTQAAGDVLSNQNLTLSERGQRALLRFVSPGTARMVLSGMTGPAAPAVMGAQGYLEKPDASFEERMKHAAMNTAMPVVDRAAAPVINMLLNPAAHAIARAGASAAVNTGQTAVENPDADVLDLLESGAAGAAFHGTTLARGVKASRSGARYAPDGADVRSLGDVRPNRPGSPEARALADAQEAELLRQAESQAAKNQGPRPDNNNAMADDAALIEPKQPATTTQAADLVADLAAKIEAHRNGDPVDLQAMGNLAKQVQTNYEGGLQEILDAHSKGAPLRKKTSGHAELDQMLGWSENVPPSPEVAASLNAEQPKKSGYLARRRAQKQTQRNQFAREVDDELASVIPPDIDAPLAPPLIEKTATIEPPARGVKEMPATSERLSVGQRIGAVLEKAGIAEPIGKNPLPPDELSFGVNPVAAAKSIGKALQSNINDSSIPPTYDPHQYATELRKQVADSIRAGRLDPTWARNILSSVQSHFTKQPIKPTAKFTADVQTRLGEVFDAFNRGDGAGLAHAQRELASLVQSPRHKFIADVTRPLMLGTELSMVGIQGGWNVIAHPVITARAALLGLKSAKTNSPSSWFTQFQQSPKQAITELLLSDSSRGYDEITQAIRNHAYTKTGEKAGLELDTQAELDASMPFHERTEGYASSAIRKLPLWRQTERFGKVFMDAQRLMLFEKGAQILEGKGKTQDANPGAFEELARSINIASGRGQLGSYQRVAKFLTNFGTSPRLILSQFQLLNPKEFARAHKADPSIAHAKLADTAKVTGFALAMMGLASNAGWEVRSDPDDPQFGMAKRPNSDYAISFLPDGLRPQLKYMGRVIKNFSQLRELGLSGALGETGKDTMRYLRSKSAPLFSAIIDQSLPYRKAKFSAPVAPSENVKNRPDNLLKAGLQTFTPQAYQWLDQHTRWGYGTDFLNRPVTALDSVTQRMMPIYWNTIYDVLHKEGLTVEEKAARIVPEFFGKATSDFTPTFQPLEIWSNDLNAELHKHRIKPSVKQLDGESRALYKDRATRAQQMLNHHGEKLLKDELYKTAKPEQQAAMMRLLDRRITDATDGQANKKRSLLAELSAQGLRLAVLRSEHRKRSQSK